MVMLMANQTIVSVPTKFQEFKQVRAFAVKLVEQLDLVLGYRGAVGYEEAGTAEQLTQQTLASLSEAVSDFESALDAIRDDLNVIRDSIVSYQSGVTITDIAYTAPTISGAYVQAEVQAIADEVETVGATLDSLFAALRAVNIIE